MCLNDIICCGAPCCCDGKYTDHSFSFNKAGIETKNVQFLRATDISEKATFIKDQAAPSDVQQGCIGDCYFLSALASVAKHWHMLQRSIVYANLFVGKFTFRLYDQEVKRVRTITIDDYLPVQTGTKSLVFGRSKDPDEFWVSLFEKAYAKMRGGYHKIAHGGYPEVSIQTLLGGGLAHVHSTKEKRDTLWDDMIRYSAQSQGSFVSCWGVNSTRKEQGLVDGHAYSVLRVCQVKMQGTMVKLIKIRNPWGTGGEWQGKWGDSWSGWNDRLREALGTPNKDDGTFWMQYEDFLTYWGYVGINTIGSAPSLLCPLPKALPNCCNQFLCIERLLCCCCDLVDCVNCSARGQNRLTYWTLANNVCTVVLLIAFALAFIIAASMLGQAHPAAIVFVVLFAALGALAACLSALCFKQAVIHIYSATCMIILLLINAIILIVVESTVLSQLKASGNANAVAGFAAFIALTIAFWIVMLLCACGNCSVALMKRRWAWRKVDVIDVAL